MRICHVITRLIVGGAQENTLLTCAGLVERGHEVTLIAGPETGPEGSLWEEAERSGARTIRLPSLVRRVSPSQDIACLKALRRIFRAERFDIIHTHSSKAGILGRLAAPRGRGGAVVHTIHGMSFNRTQAMPVQWLYRTLERRAARRTDAFISVCDAMTKQAVAAGLGSSDRFTTIYSGMATDRYTPDPVRRRATRADWGVSDDDIVIGTVARLFRNKGYEELIEAMPPAIVNVPKIKFVWVGDGKDRARYAERLRRIGISDRVHLTGLVPPDDIPRLVGGFDVLVHASRWEGLPRAVVQALLMEVPAVAFDIDGTPEVIEDDVTGRLAPLGDAPRLAASIVELARNDALRRRMGAEGRRRCLDRFDAKRMVEAIEKLYLQRLSK